MPIFVLAYEFGFGRHQRLDLRRAAPGTPEGAAEGNCPALPSCPRQPSRTAAIGLFLAPPSTAAERVDVLPQPDRKPTAMMRLMRVAA